MGSYDLPYAGPFRMVSPIFGLPGIAANAAFGDIFVNYLALIGEWHLRYVPVTGSHSAAGMAMRISRASASSVDGSTNR